MSEAERPVCEADLQDVPMFVLPGLVLFPGTLLPLHLFEPRYRALCEASLARTPSLLLVAQVKPGFEAELAGSPPVHATLGLGRIQEHRRNPDGTFDVLLRGEARAFVEAELEPGGLPYRRARVRTLPERDGRLQSRDLVSLMALAQRIALLARAQQSNFELGAEADDPPGLLTDRLADQLLADPAERQDLLETLDVAQRAQVLIRKLAALHAELSSDPDGPTTLH